MPGDQREPLWASSLAEEPLREDYDEVFAEPEARQEAVEPRRDPLPALVIAVTFAIAFAALTFALAPRGTLELEEVPSFWGEIPMTCETARFEQDARAFELFECHALDGATLPYGVYETPESQWTSDLTRQNAIENVIVISREGQLKGMAVY